MSFNQTADTSPIYQNSQLPFRIHVSDSGVKLAEGLQSFCFGVYAHKWLLVSG